MSTLYKYVDRDFDLSHSRSTAPDPSRFRLHTHTSAEIYYFCGGCGVFHIEGSDYPLESGDLLVMQSAESHYIELDPNQPYERKILQLNTSVLRGIDPDEILLKPLLDRKSGKQNLYRGYQFRGGSCEHYFNTMLTPEGNPRIHIFAGLLPLLHELLSIRANSPEDIGTGSDPVAYRIISYLNQNLAQPIMLDDICKKFYISKSQLCRIFRASTGTTVRQYLTIKRLLKAQQLIEAGAHATQACFQCGFNDYSSFYRAYMKHFGCTPSERPAQPQQ